MSKFVVYTIFESDNIVFKWSCDNYIRAPVKTFPMKLVGKELLAVFVTIVTFAILSNTYVTLEAEIKTILSKTRPDVTNSIACKKSFN